MNQVTTIRQQKWIEMIRDQKQSGLTVIDWCKQANISPNCFYYRQHKLRSAAIASAPQLVEIKAPEAVAQVTTDEAQYLENKTAFISTGSISIALTNDASAELITNILRALHA